MSASSWVHLEDCTIKKITEKAVLIESEIYDGWIPLSQIDEPDRLEEGDDGITISVTEWFAKKEGIDS